MTFDFSKPINLAEVDRAHGQKPTRAAAGGATALPCPLLVSGLPTEAASTWPRQFEAMGFTAVPGLSGSMDDQRRAPRKWSPAGR